jgi:hypothetical protein
MVMESQRSSLSHGVMKHVELPGTVRFGYLKRQTAVTRRSSMAVLRFSPLKKPVQMDFETSRLVFTIPQQRVNYFHIGLAVIDIANGAASMQIGQRKLAAQYLRSRSLRLVQSKAHCASQSETVCKTNFGRNPEKSSCIKTKPFSIVIATEERGHDSC